MESTGEEMAKPTRHASDPEHVANSWELTQLAPMSIENAKSRSAQHISESRTIEEQDNPRTPSDPFRSMLRDHNVTQDGAATPRDVMVALTYGLELVRHGAMLVAFEGRPQLANRAALAILGKKDGLSMARTGLVAERTADTKLLQTLLHEAIRHPELGEPKDSPITLPRKSTHHALIVRVVPGPGLDCWPGTDNRTALMKMYDQDMGLAVDAGVLIRLYGLTRGEAALVEHLVQGRSIEDAAAELFISTHTARTHLKRIFMKTDTHRQTELVVRILSAVL
ncbi:MAG: helix-turn-helix transcriptional regulator [Candidatus Sulfotelmatobacter sp.]